MSCFRALCLVGLLAVPSAAVAQTNAEKGYEIVSRATQKDDGFGDVTVSGNMILRDASGQESKRNFDLKTLETGSGEKTLLVFDWPGDIRGTALLTHSSAKRDDDQWVYLPALKRVKRISGSGRSSSFVGSEFAYEDMVNQDIDKFDYEWISDGACPSAAKLKCHAIQRVPKYKSGYASETVYLDTGQLRVMSVDYFNRGGKLVKTLTASGYERYQNKFWRASLIRMQNRLNGKSSDLTWSDFRFGVGLSEGQFTPNSLQQ